VWHAVRLRNRADREADAVPRRRSGRPCLIIDAETDRRTLFIRATTCESMRRRVDGLSRRPRLLPYADTTGVPYSVFSDRRRASSTCHKLLAEIGRGRQRGVPGTPQPRTASTRPIYPLGQTYGSPPAADIHAFRDCPCAMALRASPGGTTPGPRGRLLAASAASMRRPARRRSAIPRSARDPGAMPCSGCRSISLASSAQRTTGLFGSLTLGVRGRLQAHHTALAVTEAPTRRPAALLRRTPSPCPGALDRRASTGARRAGGFEPRLAYPRAATRSLRSARPAGARTPSIDRRSGLPLSRAENRACADFGGET